jgi:hypothetical protein
MAVVVGIGQQLRDRAADGHERGHDVAEQKARRRDGFPDQKQREDERDAQRQDQARDRRLAGRGYKSTGLSHRSILSVTAKNKMLTRTTKQIAA